MSFVTGIYFWAVVVVVMMGGCASFPSPAQRLLHADELAATHGWRGEVLHAGEFDLRSYVPAPKPNDDSLTVYIEGDGLAWRDRSTPSADPTPRDPLALRLALAHPEGNVAYLGRPCQYVGVQAGQCAQRYWTDARFAPEVVNAVNLAVDQLKGRFAATRLTLVGYSGGGAVATL